MVMEDFCEAQALKLHFQGVARYPAMRCVELKTKCWLHNHEDSAHSIVGGS